MAKNVGEKPRRITHLGNSSSSSSNMTLGVDYIQNIMKDMDSMKNLKQHIQFENALKFLKNKPEVVPNVPENPPEYNIHGTKIVKTVASNKYFPLMAKCQRNLKYLLHNRSIPKPRAHIKKISKSPLKKKLPKFTRCLTNNERPVCRNEKVQQTKTFKAFKRSFPKPESDSIKACQPAKKIHKDNSILNVSKDSKQCPLVSEKIRVTKKKVESCGLPDDKYQNHYMESSKTSKHSEKDTDDDFETFVKKHKGKHSLRSKKSGKKINISTDSSSDEEVEREKSKFKKKASKTKCLQSENKISIYESRRKQSDSPFLVETNKSNSRKPISDALGKGKCSKKETYNKFLQNKSSTIKFNHPKEKRSGYLTESSDSESAEMFSNNICSTSSDECFETAVKPLCKINVENDANKMSAELTNETIMHNVCEEEQLNVFNDTSVGFKDKKTERVNVLDAVSDCSVILKRNHDIDKQAKNQNLDSRDLKNAVINNSCSQPPVMNKILIEISDEDDGQNESSTTSECKGFSDLSLTSSNNSNNRNIDINPVKKVRDEKTKSETAINANTAASDIENKITDDKEDSDIEIIEINTPTCSVGKYHQNGTSVTNNDSISQENKLNLHDIAVEENDQHLSKAPVEQLYSSCEESSFGVSKNVPIKENLKLSNTQVKPEDGNTNLTAAVDSNEDDVTVIDAIYAADQKNVSKCNGHVITSPVQKEQTAKINQEFLLSSDKNKCEELSKTDDEEFVKSCSKSLLGEFTTGKGDTLVVSAVKNSSFSKNIPISDEDDCVILEPTGLTQELNKFNDVSLQNESLKGSSVHELKIAAAPKNARGKLLSSNCSPENAVENTGFLEDVAKDVISINNANKISGSSCTKLSNTSESEELKDLENDCIILDDSPVEVLTKEVKLDSFYKDKCEKELIKNNSCKAINCTTAIKRAVSATSCELNKIKPSFQNIETFSDFSSVCSTTDIPSNINKDIVSNASFVLRQTSHFKTEENSFIKNRTKCLQKPIEQSSASNVELLSVKSESSSSHQQNRRVCSDTCNIKNNSLSDNVEQNIQHKVENNASLPMESSIKREMNFPFVNELVQYSDSDVDPQKFDKKPCIYPSPVCPTGDKTDKNCTLNLENFKEFKEPHCNISPHPAVFHHDTSNIPQSNTDLPSSVNLNTVDLDSVSSLKTLEIKSFLNSSFSELDAVTESSIYELSCTENKSLLPLFNLYKNEVKYYQKLQQTVKNVDAGIRSALDLQAERLKHLSFSIKNIVANDPCFRNSFNERPFLPVKHKQIAEHGLPDNIPYSSARDTKEMYSFENVNDFSNATPPPTNTRSVNPEIGCSFVSSSCHKSINYDNIPQLSLESLHENRANCVDNVQQVSIKNEVNEIPENEYFEDEIKYSKSSAFSENQPEALEDLENSKCCACNEPAIGACYFCCKVFYCSTKCADGPIGEHHRATCSKNYTKTEKE